MYGASTLSTWLQVHVAQAEEIQRKLTETVLRLQDAARGKRRPVLALRTDTSLVVQDDCIPHIHRCPDYTLQGVSQRLEIISKKLKLVTV